MNLMFCDGTFGKGWLSSKFLLLMRLTIVLLLVGCIQVSAKVSAQKITFSGQNVPLEKVFESIKRQTGYLFFYNYDLLQTATPVTVSVKDMPIAEAMALLLNNEPLDFSIEDKTVVIRKKAPTSNAFADIAEVAPIVDITGQVFSDAGEPLVGAYVLLKGTRKVALTNGKGAFTIKLEDKELTEGILIFTYVGYTKQEYKVSGHKSVNITLQRTNALLEDIVITNGYTKPKRREDVVGSISTVSAKELQTSRPIESFDKMLEGLVPGMQVVTNTELGTPVSINIRGQNALSQLSTSNTTALTTSSQPLFVIDGVPITEQRKGDEPLAFLNNEQLLNPLAGINPNDIETISVLKDAAAIAVYGANGSNGVIIITTKKGKAGKAKLDVGFSSGFSNPINRIKWLSGPQYHDLAKELYTNEGKDPVTAEKLAGSNEINTDWFGLSSRSGTFNDFSLQLSGGSELAQYRISADYQSQKSIQLGNDYNKYSFTLRLDNKLSNKINVTTTIAPTFVQKNALTIYSDLVPMVPNIPAYNADSTYYTIVGVPNPLAVLNQNINYHEGGTLNGNTNIDYAITKNLRYTGNIGANILINKQNLYQSPLNETGRSLNGIARIYDRTNFTWATFHQLNWKPKINERNRFDVLAGFQAQSSTTKLLLGQGSNFTYFRLNELSAASSRNAASSKSIDNGYSVYSSIQYTLNDKYNINTSGRYDAASIFGNGVNSTVNAAVGVGWTISKEAFLRQSLFVDLLQLRASYGSSGNSRIGSSAAKGLYTFSNTYNNQTSSSPSTLPNEGLQWEKSRKIDVGIDFNFAKRFRVVVDLYQSTLYNAISNITVQDATGFSSVLANTATMRNSGFDAGINVSVFKGMFNWNTTLNMGYNKNVVLSVNDGQQKFGTSDDGTVLKSLVSTSAIWGYQFAGVNPATGIERFYNATGKLLETDKNTSTDFPLSNAMQIGDRNPSLQGGWINTFTYKGMALTVNIMYSFGSDILANYRNEWNGNNLDNRNQSVNMLDRWQQPGDITNIPKLNRQAISKIFFVVNSSRYVYNNTYLKLSNVTFSYTLPKAITQKIKTSITVFANASNLLYWNKSKSPKDRNGVAEYRYAYPETQSFTAGVRMNL